MLSLDTELLCDQPGGLSLAMGCDAQDVPRVTRLILVHETHEHHGSGAKGGLDRAGLGWAGTDCLYWAELGYGEPLCQHVPISRGAQGLPDTSGSCAWRGHRSPPSSPTEQLRSPGLATRGCAAAAPSPCPVPRGTMSGKAILIALGGHWRWPVSPLPPAASVRCAD